MKSIFVFIVFFSLSASASPTWQDPWCNPADVAQAKAGYKCAAENRTWVVTSETVAGKPVYLDVEDQIKVTSILGIGINQAEARALCPSGYSLPDGYPHFEDGSVYSNVSYPNHDSVFEVLGEAGITNVIDISAYSLWSSSEFPTRPGFAFTFDDCVFTSQGGCISGTGSDESLGYLNDGPNHEVFAGACVSIQ